MSKIKKNTISWLFLARLRSVIGCIRELDHVRILIQFHNDNIIAALVQKWAWNVKAPLRPSSVVSSHIESIDEYSSVLPMVALWLTVVVEKRVTGVVLFYNKVGLQQPWSSLPRLQNGFVIRLPTCQAIGFKVRIQP